MKYIQSKKGYYYKINSKGIKTRISKKIFLQKGGKHVVYHKKYGNIEQKENHKTNTLQEDAVKDAVEFYKTDENYNKIFVFKKGFKQYKLIPYDIDNKIFILISKNNKWKFIKYEGDFSELGKLKINVVFSAYKGFHKISKQLCGNKSTASKIQHYGDNEFRLFGLSLWNESFCNKLEVLTKMYNFIKQYGSESIPESITLYLDPKYKFYDLNEYFDGTGWTVIKSN